MKFNILNFFRYSLIFLFFYYHSVLGMSYLSYEEFLKASEINANLRFYKFTRNYGNTLTPAQNSVSLGGRLNFISAPLQGFKLGLSYYAADSLGLNSTEFSHIDPTLPGRSVNVLGQTFLQYENKVWLLRLGNQLMNTPWLNEADSRMIPAAYQGIYTTLTPNEKWKVSLLRIFRYKSRTSKEFNNTNLYTPGNYGGTPIPQMQGISVKGALAGGIQSNWLLHHHELNTQGWYYQFYDFGNLIYADTIYYYRNDLHIEPFLGGQIGKEWGDGKNYLQSFGYGVANSLFFGVKGGVETLFSQLSIGYNKIPTHVGAFKNGDIISPYATGFVYDPLYTSSMNAGLIEKSAGYAYKISGFTFFFDKKFKLYTSGAKYFTNPNTNNTTEIDFDMQYFFRDSLFKGLNLRNRLGILNGNPTLGRFLYNRLMIEYNF